MFVAEQFEKSTEITRVILDRPAGKTAWVLVVPGVGDVRIYIKLQLKSESVSGRSFHASRDMAKKE